MHELVDPLLRSGDIDSRIYNLETMQMGTLLHSAYQEKQGSDYLAEYPLDGIVETERGSISLFGRADGIVLGGVLPIVDEIKSTVAPLEEFYEQQKEWHLGQALCYAYLFLLQNEKKGYGGIEIQLTYLSQRDGEKMRKSFSFSRADVEARVKGYAEDYLSRAERRFRHIEKRDESVKGLPFPFPEFREGQRDLSRLAYGIAKRGGVLFAEAPTGVGKTICTLYPFVLSFDQKKVERIFFLTAKNTGAQAAYEAIGDLYRAGFVGRDSTLYAKEKICLCPGKACNPDDCPFAKGYYEKVGAAIEEALESKARFDFETVVALARKHGICSFEFQLDLSLEADVIVADYNYLFDPFVYLERYFEEGRDTSKTLLLVDEAHNLVERGRMMYSASLSAATSAAARKALKGKEFPTLRKHLKAVEAALDGLSDEAMTPVSEVPDALKKAQDAFKRGETKWWKNHSEALPREFVEFRRGLNRFLKIEEDYFGDNYARYAYRQGDSAILNLDCLDASSYLGERLSRLRGAVLFSATLTPMRYYMRGIAGGEEHPFVVLPSPFPPSHFKKLVAPKISVRYKDREGSYREVARYLSAFVSAKTGNYFLYFPSYKYLESIRPYLDFPGCDVLAQSRRMSEEEKLDFLASFTFAPKTTTIGLLVLGGAFSEGIDLPEDRLIGVAVVGVGMPMVCYENDRLKDYYERKEGEGFNFAYKYPGINKVTQAIGRVIRSESDVGAALLIDDRYLRGDYRPTLERLWPDYEVVLSPEEVEEALFSFYKKGKH